MKINTENRLKPSDVDVIITHHPCYDGFTAECIARHYYNENYPKKNIIYYQLQVNSYPPHNLEGKNILMIDISFRNDIITNLLPKVRNLLIIDHHKTAEKDLQNLDDKYKVFHMEYSGAMLAWFYFFPEKIPPLLVEYIQDRDLYTRKMPKTDQFVSWYYTLPFEYENYYKYLDEDLLKYTISLKGDSYWELNNVHINNSVDYSVTKFCRIKEKYYLIAYLNSTICKSDIGNKIFEKYPFIDFSAVYSINDTTNSTQFSLRSTCQHVDVSEIATELGGGGHRNACGIKIMHVTNTLPGQIFDTGQIYEEIKKIYYGDLHIGTKKYHIVYMMSNVHKIVLSRYLMQTKYTTNNVVTKVWKDISNKLNQSSPNEVHLSAIWAYDATHDQTIFNVFYGEQVTPEERGAINKELNMREGCIAFCKGLQRMLTVLDDGWN